MRVVIFGGGAVGLGFVGDLLSRAGAEQIVADVDNALVGSLNQQGRYTLNKADLERVSQVEVREVRALDLGQADLREELDLALAEADLAVTAVGARPLPEVGRLLGELVQAGLDRPRPLNVLCCENHRDAAGVLRESIGEVLGPAETDARFGCINTVVARMGQRLTRAERDLPPLNPDLDIVLLVEDYDPFPVDGGAVRGELPELACLQPLPTAQFRACEQRKLYAHNGVHALVGVLGKLRDHRHFYEVGEDPLLDRIGRRAMWEEIGAALVRAYPEYFSEAEMQGFAENLYGRLTNPVFADLIERGARDTLRMIRPEDGRLSTAALFVAGQGLAPRAMSLGIAAALRDNRLDLGGLEPALREGSPAAGAVVKELTGEALAALEREAAGDHQALAAYLDE